MVIYLSGPGMWLYGVKLLCLDGYICPVNMGTGFDVVLSLLVCMSTCRIMSQLFQLLGLGIKL